MTNTGSPATKNEPAPTRKRKWPRRLVTGLVLLLVVCWAAPLLLIRLPVRDSLINQFLGTRGLTVSTDNGTGGWMTPLELTGVKLVNEQSSIGLDVATISTDRSMSQLVTQLPDLGKITLDQPHLTLELPIEVPEKPPHDSPENLPVFVAQLNDAGLTLNRRDAEIPLVNLQGIQITAAINELDDDPSSRLLEIEPTVLFEKETLSSSQAAELLHWLAPSFRGHVSVDGQFSFRIDRLAVPIGTNPQTTKENVEFNALLELHQVQLETENPMLRLICKTVCDEYGVPMPQDLRVAKNSSIQLSIQDGRIHQRGLELGFPDIDEDLVIRSEGSVGLDETIDLKFEIPRLDQEKQSERGPVVCKVSGTIDEPVIRLKDASLVIDMPDQDEPLIDIDGVDVQMRVDEDESGSRIVFDPFAALDHEPISPELVRTVLKNIDPGLARASQLSGEISLDVEQLEIPLGVDRDRIAQLLTLRGKLTVHDVKSVANTPERLVLFEILADQLGKPPLGKEVHLVHSAEVDFELSNGVFRFSGLEAGFPDLSEELVIRSEGSVSPDESIDLKFEIPRLDPQKQAERGPVVCRVGGTIEEPAIHVEDASLVVHMTGREQPLIDIDGVNVDMRVEDDEDGSRIVFAPFTALDHEPVSERLTQTLLKRIDPGLGDASHLAGEISMNFDSLEIPVGVDLDQLAERLVASGKLTVHELASVASTPTRQALLKVVADQLGVPLGGREVRLVHNAEVEFSFRNGVFQYKGLEAGFPDLSEELVIRSQGSISLDDTIDIQFEIPRLDRTMQEQHGPVICRISGSVDEPLINIEDASLVVRLPGHSEPILAVDAVDMEFLIRSEGDQKTLIASPMTVFENMELTGEMTDELLHLVAPTLGDLTQLEGRISLAIDKLQMPLSDDPAKNLDQIELSGKLQLHQITTTAKTPLVSAMVKVLNDLYQKPPSNQVKIAKNAVVDFELRDGRIYHQGLEIGFPDISPDLIGSSEGSVGIDGSLDLVLTVPRILAGGAPGQADPSKSIRYTITGTVKDPDVKESRR